MSSAPESPSGPQPGDVSPPAIRRGRWQIGLPTVFLLIAAVAVWTTVVINLNHSVSLQARLRSMRRLARLLIVEDPDQIVVVRQDPHWFDENRWEVYLPTAGGYRVCLATRGIEPTGLAPVAAGARLEGGRHRLALETHSGPTGWRVVVTDDGAERLAVEEPTEWRPPGHPASGGFEAPDFTPLAADQTVVLLRRRFRRPVGKGRASVPSGPTEEILLWIEPIPGPSAGP